MKLLGRLLRWIGRRALLYVLLVLALAAGQFIHREWSQASTYTKNLQTLRTGEEQLRSDRDEWMQDFREATTGLETKGTEVLAERIADREREKKDAENQLKEGLIFSPNVLLQNQRRKLQIARLHHELTALYAAKEIAEGREAKPRLQAELQKAEVRCDRATAELKALDSRLSYRWRSLVESGEHKRLRTAAESACDDRDRARQRLKIVTSGAGVRELERVLASAEDDLDSTYDGVLSDVAAEHKNADKQLNGTLTQKVLLWAEARHVDSLLWRALVALLGIMAMPYAIRLLFWLVLAPVAERRSAIRLNVPGGRGASIPHVERSTTAVSIRLAADEELLVRQGYRQTTSADGHKATRWLLDWRRPFASIVSGMTFLTRIRGAGETTTVSAVRDPFAEVTVLTLPKDATCVLQPHALAAVVQPIDRPLRLSSHWRIRSLNAWLTMQLRYIVFHGPCRLVIKGGRGVRAERAERGRIFGQAQLVGFSADLDYSVTRTETFWPYFLGHEQLFKDKVEAGEGVLIIEEAPMAGRKSASARRGLEDVFEVVTKAVGI